MIGSPTPVALNPSGSPYPVALNPSARRQVSSDLPSSSPSQLEQAYTKLKEARNQLQHARTNLRRLQVNETDKTKIKDARNTVQAARAKRKMAREAYVALGGKVSRQEEAADPADRSPRSILRQRHVMLRRVTGGLPGQRDSRQWNQASDMVIPPYPSQPSVLIIDKTQPSKAPSDCLVHKGQTSSSDYKYDWGKAH